MAIALVGCGGGGGGGNEGRISVATRSSQVSYDLRTFRLTDAEMSSLFDAINRSVADEAHLKDRIAVVRQGETLTERLAIAKEKGWFRPMLSDLLSQGVSIVINDIQITQPIANAIGRHADVPPDWVTQQNLYVTPGESQGFDPHCDPHMVVVAHLYGRKVWTIYDKLLDNPVYDAETNTVADKSSALGVRSKIKVGPGEGFVIPRGLYHSAVALSPASVHLAVGAAGARPIDTIWTMADRAIQDPAMRADMTPDEALKEARDYMARLALEPVRLPRFPRSERVAEGTVSSLSFQEVLDSLPGD